MKIESEAILDWLTAERRRIREELALARLHWWDGQTSVLLGRLEEVDKAIIAVKEYRGDIEQ